MLQSTGDWLALGAFIVSILGTLNSLRKTQIDYRSGAIVEIQAVVKTLKEENERLEHKLDDTEEQCELRISGLQAQLETAKTTIIAQAGQIAKLQEHTRGAGV